MKKLIFALAIAGSLTNFAASKKINSIAIDDKVQLRSRLEFSEDGAWAVSSTPVYNNLIAVSETTNNLGVINTTYKYDYVISSYILNKQLIDSINGFSVATKPAYTVIPVTSGIIATIDDNNVITANKEGAVTIIANDGDRIVTKNLAFKTYANGNTITYYTGDTNDYVNSLYTEWYEYLAKRDLSETKLITGFNTCKGYVAKNDFVWNDNDFHYYIGKGYNSDLYIPVSAISFRLLDINNSIKYSGNAIGNKVALDSNAYSDIPDSSIYVDRTYIHKWMKPDGTTGTVKTAKAYNLAVWATSKGIYYDTEIAGVTDTVAYVYDSEIPDECQASIIKATIYGDGAPSVTNCLQLSRSCGFSISQHGTVVPQYFTGVCGYTYDGSAANIKCSNADFRKDGLGIDQIDPYHSGHTGESGRPWFYVYSGNPILIGCYHFANDAYSYAMGWRIIKDFCIENGSTCNLYDMISKTKTVVTPTL